MGRLFKTDRSLNIRINRLFKYSLLFSWVIGFFVPASAFLANTAPSDPSFTNPAFSIATRDKRTDVPVQWVSAGGGVLAYGAGQHVDFAFEHAPFSPISHLSFDGVISGALILGKYALLSQEGLGLRMIDLSMPSNPLEIGFYPLSGTVFHLASWGTFLFVAGVEPGIQIFELSYSNGQNPQISLIDRGSISVPDPITAIAATDLTLYVAVAGKGIRIYDVSDPSLVLEVDGLPVTLPVRSMAINGDSLYVAAGAEGLHVVDLSVPWNPGLLATHPAQSESLFLAGRLVYLATGSDGLHLLKAGPIGAAFFAVIVAPSGNLTFSPSTVNLNAGDSINWVWGASFHSTTSGTNCAYNGPGPNTWDSGVHDEGFMFQTTHSTPGSFPFFCSLHCGSGMVGTVNVAGAGPVINISVNPTTTNFGNVNVGQFLDHTITLTNQATSNATLTGSVGTLSAPFSVQSGGGAFNLTPGQSVTVTVRFSPTAAGTVSDNLSITHNATNQTSPTTVALSGTGVVPGINISIIPSSVIFGNVNVGQSSNQNITILNQANSIGAFTGTIGTPAAPFSVITGGGPFNLTPGQSMIVAVQFSPTAAGAASDNLSITHNATNQTSPTTIPLSGAGVTTPLPDLVVSSISGPTLNKPGGRIVIANTITNQGTQSAGSFVVNFYLSTDQQITTSDIFLGKRSIRGLAAGESSGPVSTNVTITRSVTTGSYFIGAIVDPTNVILESDEGNNTAFDPAGINICLSLAKPKLVSPKNRGTNISTSPTLTWSSVIGASTYEVQAATDSAFTNIVGSTTGLTTPQWAVTPALSSGTTYSWRARGVNLCGPGPFSATSSFKTAP